MNLKAITFDLDGTLYPEHRILFPSLAVALRHPRFIYLFSRVRKEIRAVHPIHDFKRTQAELLARHLGRPVAETAALIEDIIYTRWLAAIRNMRPYAGVRDIIVRLKQAGYKVALLSDLPISRKIRYLNLEGIWDLAFSSEETGYLKPNPAPFLRLLEGLGTTPPETIYIGNNYEYDVVGAKGLGMKTVFFSRKRIRGNQADFVFRRYADLERFLLSLLDGKE